MTRKVRERGVPFFDSILPEKQQELAKLLRFQHTKRLQMTGHRPPETDVRSTNIPKPLRNPVRENASHGLVFAALRVLFCMGVPAHNC